MTVQKGLDLLLDALPTLLAHGGQLAMLGKRRCLSLKGRLCTEAAKENPGRIGVVFGYDEPLSHQLQAGGGCDHRAVALRALRSHATLRSSLRHLAGGGDGWAGSPTPSIDANQAALLPMAWPLAFSLLRRQRSPSFEPRWSAPSRSIVTRSRLATAVQRRAMSREGRLVRRRRKLTRICIDELCPSSAATAGA